MRIRAVILDFGGTLAEGELAYSKYHNAILHYLRDQGYTLELGDIRKAIHLALSHLELVRSKGKELTFEEVYSRMLDDLNIPKEMKVLEDLHEIFRKNYDTKFFPCIRGVLEELSNIYKLAMISNTMSDKPKLMLKEEGLEGFFDLLVCSRDLAIRKPNPKIFRYVLRQIGTAPDETAHVGDNIEADMRGAKMSGLNPIWIRQEGKEWDGYVINSICDLPSFLRGFEG